MAVLHFTDAQKEEQLLAGQEVAELAMTHQASPLSWVSTGGGDGYFVNINLESVKLEKEMATHSSVLAWRIPGTAEPGGLPSMGLHRVGHD